MTFLKEVVLPIVLVSSFAFLYLLLYALILELFGWTDPGGAPSIAVGLIIGIISIFSGMGLSLKLM